MSHVLFVVMMAIVLGLFEVSFSFDNAVVNAKVLKDMSKFWQKMFLTIGILIAVFGMRLVFPIVIVHFVTDLSFMDTFNLALNDPNKYANYLQASHIKISMFGGAFLMMVFFAWLYEEKEENWLGIEKSMEMAPNGYFDNMMPGLSTIFIAFIVGSLSNDFRLVMQYAVIGVGLYLAIDFLSGLLGDGDNQAGKAGIGAFLYLEVLDASFSFDGVIGAFAVTKDIVIIMLGLGIGAMFVRSLTIYFVEQKTLEAYRYLEHGAHWAIGVLALIMFLSTQFHISEIFTGLIGIAVIGLALRSSIKANKEG